MKTRLEILRQARALCVKAWVPHAPKNRDQHCLGTAILTAGNYPHPEAMATCRMVASLAGIKYLPGWSDSRTLADVLALLDRAIAKETELNAVVARLIANSMFERALDEVVPA